MSGGTSQRAHKPRELRHRVIAAARLRRPRGWSDALILNISSRGLQIQTSWPLDEGSWVELRRGHQIIRAQVIWNKGVRAGLLADGPLAVEEIVNLTAASRSLAAPAPTERRRQPRSSDQERLRGRLLEFAGVLGVILILVFGLFEDFQLAIARPLSSVSQALR